MHSSKDENLLILALSMSASDGLTFNYKQIKE